MASLSASVATSVIVFAVFCVIGTDRSVATGARFPGTDTFVVAMTVFGLLGVQSAFTGPIPVMSTLAMTWNGMSHLICVPPSVAPAVAVTRRSGVAWV